MATRNPRPDPKQAALAETRCPTRIPSRCATRHTGERVLRRRDLVQVKYEMVRRVKAEGASVTSAAAAFGYSRPSYYEAAAALERSGLEGLVPARPGRRGAHKLTEDICAWADQQLRGDPGLRPAALAGQMEAAFGVRAHPRSIERALARYRERHSKSR